MKKLLLVDGSSYLYRAFHAMPDFRSLDNQPTGVIYGVLNMLRHIHKKYPSDYSVCIFDAKGKTFRNDIYPEYKANRPKMPEELAIQIEPLKEAIEAMGFPILIRSGVEADDVIGTLAQKANHNSIDVVISTADKDLAQLVNKQTKLINTMTNEELDIEGVKNKFGVPPELIVDYLTIIGDKVDNVPGVDKVGPRIALKWLSEHKSLEKIVKNSATFKGVVGENLRKAIDWLPTAKDLMTIRCDLDINVNWDEFVKKSPDNKILETIYKEFNFSRWLQDLQQKKIFIFKRAFPVRGYLSTNQGALPKVNTSVFLMVEEDNSYDKFAVSIFTTEDLDKDSKIGYLPKNFNKLYHEFLKLGGIYSSYISQINTDSKSKNWDFVFINISLSINNQEEFNLLLKDNGIPSDNLSIDKWLDSKPFSPSGRKAPLSRKRILWEGNDLETGEVIGGWCEYEEMPDGSWKVHGRPPP